MVEAVVIVITKTMIVMTMMMVKITMLETRRQTYL